MSLKVHFILNHQIQTLFDSLYPISMYVQHYTNSTCNNWVLRLDKLKDYFFRKNEAHFSYSNPPFQTVMVDTRIYKRFHTKSENNYAFTYTQWKRFSASCSDFTKMHHNIYLYINVRRSQKVACLQFECYTHTVLCFFL